MHEVVHVFLESSHEAGVPNAGHHVEPTTTILGTNLNERTSKNPELIV
jgi:hypothetical protein